MSNLNKAINWRLEKNAAGLGDAARTIARNKAIRDGVIMTAAVGTPVAGGVIAGGIHSKLAAPKKEELQAIQAKYTTAKIQQALEELERNKKQQMLKETFNGNSASLRI